MNRKKSSVWCSQLWTHQFIGPGGRIKPCCRFKNSYVPKDMVLSENFKSEKAFNSQFMNNIRQDMLNEEQIPGCQRCYDEESSGKKRSLRQYYNGEAHINENIDIASPKISYFELSFSNLCNLRCTMCNPDYSTNWNKDWEKFTGDSVKLKNQISADLVDSLDSGIRHIKMTGGEPFLIKAYEEILERVVDLGYANKVYLNYSTNLMIEPSERLINLWKKFKRVELALSVDGIKSVAEYVRYPSKWDKIESVTSKLLNLENEINVVCGLRPTIMTYNILDLPNIGLWWLEQREKHNSRSSLWFNPTHLSDPAELSIRVFPNNIKEKITKRLMQADVPIEIQKSLEYMCKYMNEKDESSRFHDFIQRTKKIDSIRSLKMSTSLPELSKLLS